MTSHSSMDKMKDEFGPQFQLGQNWEQAREAEEKIREGGKKGGETRKQQLGHEGYAEMGRKGGSVRAEAAKESAIFATHPDGALREGIKGRPMDDQYVNPFAINDATSPEEVRQQIEEVKKVYE